MSCRVCPGDNGEVDATALRADVDSVKDAMVQAADMHARIYQSYNLPYDPAPGSIMDKAMKLWRKKQSRK